MSWRELEKGFLMDGRFKGDLPHRTFEFAKSVLDLVDELLRILGTIVAKSQKRLRPERSMDSVT